jgi:hypothetical protein
MRHAFNFLVWTMLVVGTVATVRWAGDEPEEPQGLTIDGRPLAAAPGLEGPRHDPRTCRSCNIGTQAQWETR